MRSKPNYATLVIYDVSSVIYAGNSTKYGSDFVGGERVGNDRVKGLPVGGVRRLLQFALLELSGQSSVVFVFDSHTSKRSAYPEYKSQRTYNPEIAIQKEMAYEIAQRLGIPCMRVDGYEADDLVASIVEKEFDNFSAIKIVTGDTDLAANITSMKVTIEGAASIYPCIDMNSYPNLIKSGDVVEYNAVLPYYLFMGKTSNCVKSWKKPAESRALLASFLNWAKGKDINSSEWSKRYVILEWLLEQLDAHALSTDEVQECLARIEVVYPKEYEDEYEIPAIDSTDINKYELLFFTRLFSMERIASLYDMRDEYLSMQLITKASEEFLAPYRQMLQSGDTAIAVDSSPDISFFVNRTSNFESTDIGGF